MSSDGLYVDTVEVVELGGVWRRNPWVQRRLECVDERCEEGMVVFVVPEVGYLVERVGWVRGEVFGVGRI